MSRRIESFFLLVKVILQAYDPAVRFGNPLSCRESARSYRRPIARSSRFPTSDAASSDTPKSAGCGYSCTLKMTPSATPPQRAFSSRDRLPSDVPRVGRLWLAGSPHHHVQRSTILDAGTTSPRHRSGHLYHGIGGSNRSRHGQVNFRCPRKPRTAATTKLPMPATKQP